MNIRFLEKQNDESSTALKKYARVGHLLRDSGAEDVEQGCRFLIEELKNWEDPMALTPFREVWRLPLPKKPA